jgi:hypothetical protein
VKKKAKKAKKAVGMPLFSRKKEKAKKAAAKPVVKEKPTENPAGGGSGEESDEAPTQVTQRARG